MHHCYILHGLLINPVRAYIVGLEPDRLSLSCIPGTVLVPIVRSLETRDRYVHLRVHHSCHVPVRRVYEHMHMYHFDVFA